VTYLDGSPVRPEERPSARALRGETVPVVEMRIHPPGGRARVLAVSATPLPPGAHPGRARALLLCRDVTAEHAHREELRAFAGVVAHDLRNPLSAIDGWSEVLDDGLAAGDLPTESARELLARVRSVSRRMHELIGDLLAHATSASLEIHPERVDLVALVAQVVAARQAEPYVTWGRIPPVEADPVLVRQVLDNLLGNALKYVAPGAAPRVTVSGRTDGTGFVVLRIADQGIGLPAGEHERIFEEFHRAHAGGYDGTGLGLSICRRIVARHGGTIVARDNPAGRGTVFELTLPAADAVVVRRRQPGDREDEDAGAGQVA
jgi:signal transduction histidine kinase